MFRGSRRAQRMHAGGRAAGWGGGAVLGLLHCWRACLQRGARWPANAVRRFAYLPAGAGELRVAVQDRQQQVVVRQPLRLGLGEEGGWVAWCARCVAGSARAHAPGSGKSGARRPRRLTSALEADTTGKKARRRATAVSGGGRGALRARDQGGTDTSMDEAHSPAHMGPLQGPRCVQPHAWRRWERG